ncbi:protein PLASTID MOVEMENT IMPAIRED 1-RELATED 1-like [Vicia villosa]|uniref:protein PLASTID MOVEMENT IMPAIRED 1-RELATED 1-like n=1 Tax=Vicia villosa TaxID=3911 RepID=UPI00273C313A|nr:protein PLASTID MOVEMENT IMPAIRED 1-RELATED 1-like [Vicia villosa]
MLSRMDSKKNSLVSGNQKKLLKDVDTMSKAMHLDRNASRSSVSGSNSNSRAKTTGKPVFPDSKPKAKGSNSNDDNDGLQKDKRSIWNWRPLKALSHIRNKRFNCSFYLHVHLIEGLPSTFNGSSFSVYWKRRDGVLVTRAAKVVQSVVEFDEKLTYTCSVYGSRSGPHHSAKYEAKHFLLYASLLSAPELDLGKHRVDLTRLLPLTLEELEEEKSSGEWTTSFRLSGKAKGAVMNVSFGYTVVGDNASATKDGHNAPNVLTSRQSSLALMKPDVKQRQYDGSSSMRRAGSFQGALPVDAPPAKNLSRLYSSQAVESVKDLHEVLPSSKSALASSIGVLYKKFDEEKESRSEDNKPDPDLSKENIEVIKPDACASSDIGKETPEVHAVNDENTCPVLDTPELDVSHENLETNTQDDYLLLDSEKENPEDCQDKDFLVVDKGIEISTIEPVKVEESFTKASEDASTVAEDASTVDSTFIADTAGLQVSSEDTFIHGSLHDANDGSKDQTVVDESACEDDDLLTNELLQELEAAINSVSDLETVALESPKVLEFKSEYKMRKTDSLDDVTESVANEFLSMLDIDHSSAGSNSENEPESPRELLLRQFEKESLGAGFSLFDFDMDCDNEAGDDYDASTGSEQLNFSEAIHSSSLFQNLNKDHLVETRDVKGKQKAQMLEDLETEALMREWGLNEKAFHHSPPKDYAGFGSPIQLPPEELPTLPPLAEGLGPFLQTKDGGYLRSMNPSIFKNTKAGGSLVMQVSNPVVVPAEMGSGIMEVLQCLASVGIEKLSMQAKELMPLEDVTGKTMQQVAWEAMPALEGTERQCHLQPDSVTGQDAMCVQRDLKGTPPSGPKSGNFNSRSVANQTGSEFVSIDDLAPLAMNKIEALSMEGLRIQSGMSEEEAPSNIVAQSIGEMSALQGKGIDISGSLGMEGAAGLQLMDVKDSSDSDSVDGIMSLSLTLDEWMKLDSGDIDDIDNISEHTSKLLAAHHANSFDFIRGSSKSGDRRRGKGSGRRCGLLGNNFTVALMVQLRDPLRNYEPVGTPMLALIQVEREFVLPKQKIFCSVSELRNYNNDEDDEGNIIAKVEEIKDTEKEEKISEAELIPQFKITEVHVAGLKTEPQKKKLWGTSTQQQSGSRWLVANGMGKNSKFPAMKSKAAAKSIAPVTTKVQQPGETLWSISSRLLGSGKKWKESAAQNPHIRNPNVIIPNDTVRHS